MHRAAAVASSFSSSSKLMSSSKNASRAEREAKVKTLWKQRRELAPWAAALAAAPARAAHPSAGARLAAKPELDSFYYERLPQQLLEGSSSSPSSALAVKGPLAALTAEQLAGVVEWKLARGTWRPRLLDFAKAAKQADVSAAAEAAANVLKSEKGLGAAVDALCGLKGIGPATATALLSAADPSIPFLSDEALIAVLGAREYTKPAALKVTEALRERAGELNKLNKKQEEEKIGSPAVVVWNASKVERALWSASRAEDDEKEEGKGEAGEEEKGEEANQEKKEKKKRKLR